MAWCLVYTTIENHRLRQRLHALQNPPMGGRLRNTETSKLSTMSTQKPNLTARDHKNMDAFLGHVLDDYKAGEITKDEAIGALAHVMAALDQGNTGEAVNWFEQGRKFIRSTR